MPCLELCWHHPGRLPWALGVPLGEANGDDSGWHSHRASATLCIPPVPLLSQEVLHEYKYSELQHISRVDRKLWLVIKADTWLWLCHPPRWAAWATDPLLSGLLQSLLGTCSKTHLHVLHQQGNRKPQFWDRPPSPAVAGASRGRAVSPALGGVTQKVQCGQTLPSPQRALPRALVYF